MIAVTGIGVIASTGVGKDAMLDALREGRPAIGLPEDPAFGEFRVGEVRGFRVKDFIPAMKARRLSRFTQLALCSAIQAVEDSGLDLKAADPFGTAVVFGTSLASTGSTDRFYEGLLQNGPEDTNPMLFPETVPNAASGQIAIHFGITGPNTTFSQNEISSELALDYSMRLLLGGKVDAALAGCAEEINPTMLTALDSLKLISRSGASPFDRRRDGIAPAEGGAVLVLEREEDARRRGAHIHALIRNPVALVSADVDGMHYDASGESMRQAMNAALNGTDPDSVDMISAAANGTRELDGAEAGAIEAIFGGRVPVTAISSYTGSSFSDGLIRAAGTILAVNEGIVPGIAGLKEPDAGSIQLSGGECREVRRTLVNSFSFGGGAASVLFEKPQ